MSENYNASEYDFLELINVKEKDDSDGIDLFYTQVLNGRRIQKNDVVYAFDEVGCGKTISSIMCMASVIKQKMKEGAKAKILVITPKSVCNQFEGEINKVLKTKSAQWDIAVDSVAFNVKKEINGKLINIVENKENLEKDILENIQPSDEYLDKHVIVVTNHHKLSNGIFRRIDWDLVVVDEAHDIVCNNKKQINAFSDIYFEPAYSEYIENLVKLSEEKIKNEKLKNNIALLTDRKEVVEKICKEYAEEESDGGTIDKQEHIKFLKFMIMYEYNGYIKMMENMFGIDEIDIKQYLINLKSSRHEDTIMYSSLCFLNSRKVVFLSATPYKSDKNIDFCSYTFAASKIISDSKYYFDVVYKHDYMPSFDWIDNVYSANQEKFSLEEIENSNTSLWFKEVAQAIPYDCKNIKESKVVCKKRVVEIWKDDDRNNFEIEPNHTFFRDKIFEIIDMPSTELKNRIIIFVSNSMEGVVIFKKLFYENEKVKDGVIDISKEFKTHRYIHKREGKKDIVCEFIMNKFGNSKDLKKYSHEEENNTLQSGDENTKIPDILIVTYQVAQVGVNLPTFNYVINYHIPSSAGALEQRYGRIDRLNTKHDVLHNIYYIDSSRFSNIYKSNLISALYQYRNEIINRDNNLPVKNLLLCDGLEMEKINARSAYVDLANYLYAYCTLCEDGQYEKIDKWIIEINEAFGNVQVVRKDKIIEVKYANEVIETEKMFTAFWEDEVLNFDGDKSDEEQTENKKIGANPKNKQMDMMLSSIDKVMKTILKADEINKCVEELNDSNKIVMSPGNIIYIPHNNQSLKENCNVEEVEKKLTVSSETIVKNIIEALNKRSQNYQNN